MISELSRQIGENLGLTEEQQNAMARDARRTQLRYRLEWLPRDLKRIGMIEVPSAGLWRLTDDGWSVSREEMTMADRARLSNLRDAEENNARTQEKSSPVKRVGSGAGYQRDVEVKLAVEKHAIDLACMLYQSEGYEYEVIGAPYDLTLRRGAQEIHVEVKGSTETADTVELTRNEVEHASDRTIETHLVVVDQVVWRRESGVVVPSGGRLRRWRSWSAEERNLKATRYRYQLPGGFKLLPTSKPPANDADVPRHHRPKG